MFKRFALNGSKLGKVSQGGREPKFWNAIIGKLPPEDLVGEHEEEEEEEEDDGPDRRRSHLVVDDDDDGGCDVNVDEKSKSKLTTLWREQRVWKREREREEKNLSWLLFLRSRKTLYAS